VIGDDAPVSPDTHYGAAKAAVEAFVQSWGAQGWSIAALRPTGIYGVIEPLRRTKWHDIVQDVLSGKGAEMERAGSEVHGRDVAEAVWLLLTADESRIAGRSFNCSDVVVSTRDVVDVVQRVTGRSGPLPSEAARPGNVMECPGLAELGMRFGGRALFEETVSDLVKRCVS
jgi:nucleoside-diphosphate-sugar epimerase